jgi:hypothetical protein
MRQYVYQDMLLSELKDHFDAIESSAYSVSLFTDWQKQRINEVWIKSRVEEGQAFHATPVFVGAKLARPSARYNFPPTVLQLGGDCVLPGLKEVSVATARPPLRFCQGGGIGVVIHLYGHLIRSAHFLGQRVVMPDREIGRIDNNPSFGI